MPLMSNVMPLSAVSATSFRSFLIAATLVAFSARATAQSTESRSADAKPSVAEAASASAAHEARRAELLRKLDDLERRIQKETDGRVRYLGPSTGDEPFKSYYKRFTARVEERGTARFPKRTGKSVYGRVLLNAHVDAHGKLEDVQLIKAEDQFLAKHSVAILRSIALEPFPPEMAKLVDRVVIFASFDYTHE
jgi:outer membrane biosynthesis protein TonB